MLEENKKFVGWFGRLMTHEQKYFRSEIALACDVSRVTVYSWLGGDVRIKLPYKRIINNLTGERVFEVGDDVSALAIRRGVCDGVRSGLALREPDFCGD